MIAASLLRRLEKRRLNILCMPTHERYETNLAKTGHNFFSLQFPGFKEWHLDCAPLPENYTVRQVRIIAPGQVNLNIPSIKWDYVLSQEKTKQFSEAQNLANHFNVPLISLEHTGPL